MDMKRKEKLKRKLRRISFEIHKSKHFINVLAAGGQAGLIGRLRESD
jgi:hypothetical protein